MSPSVHFECRKWVSEVNSVLKVNIQGFGFFFNSENKKCISLSRFSVQFCNVILFVNIENLSMTWTL